MKPFAVPAERATRSWRPGRCVSLRVLAALLGGANLLLARRPLGAVGFLIDPGATLLRTHEDSGAQYAPLRTLRPLGLEPGQGVRFAALGDDRRPASAGDVRRGLLYEDNTDPDGDLGVRISVVPEPATPVLSGLGPLGRALARLRARRRRPCCVLGLVGLAGLATLPVHAQDTTGGVELAELLHATMLAPKASAPPSWASLQVPGIRWKTRAPVAAPRAFLPIGPLWREGSLVLLDAGNPVYTDAAQRPGAWALSAHGTPQGVVEWSLTMSAMAEEAGVDLEGLARRTGFVIRPRCEPTGVSSGAKVWLLGRPQRSVMVLREAWSAGSAGSSWSLTVPYTRSRVAQAQCL